MELKDLFALCRGLDEEAIEERFGGPCLLEKERNSRDARSVFLLRADGDAALSVGRGEACHLRVRDNQVSSKHAELLPPTELEPTWRLVDLDSTNNTFVDSVQIAAQSPVELRDELEIRFGPNATFQFLSPRRFLELFADQLGGPRPSDEIPDEPTQKFSKVDREEDPVQLSLAGYVEPDPTEELLLLCPPRDPISLRPGKKVVVGRKASHADIVIDHKKVSRAHAEIERRLTGGVYIRDLGSTNGSLVGGTKLGMEWTPLPFRVPVEIGDARLFVTPAQRKRHGSTQKAQRPPGPKRS